MIRLAIVALFAVVLAWLAYQVVKRIVLAAMVVLMIVLSGCNFYAVPDRPRIHWCFPVNSWRCNPDVKWSDM